MSEMRARPIKTGCLRDKMPFILNLIKNIPDEGWEDKGGYLPIFRHYAFISASFLREPGVRILLKNQIRTSIFIMIHHGLGIWLILLSNAFNVARMGFIGTEVDKRGQEPEWSDQQRTESLGAFG
jgi:hypothetical protein